MQEVVYVTEAIFATSFEVFRAGSNYVNPIMTSVNRRFSIRAMVK